MSDSPDWRADEAIATSPWLDTETSAWRAHWRERDPASWEGSLYVSGRYNCGPVEFPDSPNWPALYLALAPEICWAEITRHSAVMPQHNEYLLTELAVGVSQVVDCRDPMTTKLAADALIRDEDARAATRTMPRRLAAAALAAGAKGLIVPSATLLGDNLIVLPNNLNAGDSIVVVSSRPMRPYRAM